MMKRLIIGILAVLIFATTAFFGYSKIKYQAYSADVSYEQATEIISKLSKEGMSEEFNAWDIQAIDLYLISYSSEPVEDVYATDHSWILHNNV